MPLNTPIRQWQGQRVWLVGASSGIGEALARQLDSLGARQVLSARSADKLTQLSQSLQQATALPLDITDRNRLNKPPPRPFIFWVAWTWWC